MKRTVAAQVKYMPTSLPYPHTLPALVRHHVEQLAQTMPLDFAISKDFRKLLAFGSGRRRRDRRYGSRDRRHARAPQ